MSERRRSSASALAAQPQAPTTLDDVAREVRSLRMLFDQHVDEARFERERAQLRHDAIMSILKDLLTRIPAEPSEVRSA